MAVDRQLWRETFARDAIPPFPCPRCSKGILRGDPKKIVILEPKYSADARHDNENWGPDDLEERFTVILVCNHPPCGELVTFSGDSVEEHFYDNEGSMD